MKLSELPKNVGYAVLFGFMGLIVGIWASDVLYMLILKNFDRVATIYISIILILLIAFGASFVGFTKGRNLLE